MNGHCGRYTSTRTGITMAFKRWLEVISDKEFGMELCMKAPSTWNKVILRFDEYVEAGILVPV